MISSVPAHESEFESREVYVNGDLDGYALHHRGDRRKLVTPVRCCRTCAWADLPHVAYHSGIGFIYSPPFDVGMLA